jgi:hypothetical protein
MPTESYIVPVLMGDPQRCKAICDELLVGFGIYVQPINYPTVPRGTERLRLTPTPLHSDEQIDRLIAALKEIWRRNTTQYRVARSPVSHDRCSHLNRALMAQRPQHAREFFCCSSLNFVSLPVAIALGMVISFRSSDLASPRPSVPSAPHRARPMDAGREGFTKTLPYQKDCRPTDWLA